MGKEIKKETDWLGREKWVIYEGKEKVGETRKETDLLGREKQVTYDTRKEKVSETKRETDLLGREKYVTYDRGQKISETKYETDCLGRPKEVIYEKGQKIGELKREEATSDIIWGTERKKLYEAPGYDVDLTKRGSREKPPKTGDSSHESYYGSDAIYNAYGARKNFPTWAKWFSGLAIFGILATLFLQASIPPFPDQSTEKTDFDIFGTYRCQSSGQFLELRKDNTYLLGHSGKWKMDTNLYEIICFPASREEAFQALQPCTSSAIGTKLWLKDRIDSDSFEEWLINQRGGIISGSPSFVKQREARLVKRGRAVLWSKYVDHKGNFLEFKEDGTYIRILEVGRWERRSHILGRQERQSNILILKEKGEKDPTTFRDFKIEGNTLRSKGTLFVKLP